MAKISIFNRKRQKKTLIPCYRNLTAYELPDEFVALQAQDVSKVGWKQDLLRGIAKILPLESKNRTSVETTATSATIPLLERAKMYLEDGNWNEATNYYNRALDTNPSIASAYAGLLLAQRHLKNISELEFCEESLDKSSYYEKALRFGDDRLKIELQRYNQIINERNEENRVKGIYNKAVSIMNTAMLENEFSNAADLFTQINDYKDSEELAEKCKKEWSDRITKAKKALETLANSSSASSFAVNLKSQLEKIKNEEVNLQGQLSEVDSCIKECDDLRNEENEIKAKLERLFDRKSSLGVFAMRQKKITEQEIEECQNLFRRTSKRIAEITDTLKKMPTNEQIKKKLEFVGKQKADLDEQIDNEKAKQGEIESLLDEAKKVFLTYKYFLIIAKETKTLKLLAENKELLKELLETHSITSHRDIISFVMGNKQIQTTISHCYPIMRMLVANQSLFDLLPIKSRLKIQIKNSSRVFLGAYPQRYADSKQPIEWITLYRDEKMAILLSKFCLDAQKFNSSKENYVVHWENSEIRKWLNNQFFNNAFNSEEQLTICNAQLNNPAGPSERSRAGNATCDRVFLLSCDEADAYLKEPTLKGGFPTDYARAKGLEISSQTQETGWWLRTSGDGVCRAYVAYSGKSKNTTYSDPTAAMYAKMASTSGNNSSNYGNLAYNVHGVRPAILVDLTD